MEPANSKILEKKLAENHRVLQVTNSKENIAAECSEVRSLCLLSVSQYLSVEGLKELIDSAYKDFENLHLIVISDIMFFKPLVALDAFVYIINAIRYGYLFKGIEKLVKMLFGNYKKIRESMPLTSYDKNDLEYFLKTLQLQHTRIKKNLGINFHRNTIVIFKAKQS